MYQYQITPELLEACEKELVYKTEIEKRGLRDGESTPAITNIIKFESAITERMESGKSLDDIAAENADVGLTKPLIYRYGYGSQDILKAP